MLKKTITNLKRSLQTDLSNVDKDKRTVELSFSSEAPLYDWWMDADIILGHKDSEPDFSRLNDGGAFLFEHDRRQQIGVVEKAYIKEGKGRAVVRFSDKSDLAKQIFDEIVDGIRSKISVGFNISSMVRHKVENGETKTYYADKWEAHEISIVSIPADVSVGINRSLSDYIETEPRENEGEETETADDLETQPTTTTTTRGEGTMPQPVVTPKDPAETQSLEGKRNADIKNILNAGHAYGEDAFASEYIRTAGDDLSMEDFQAKLLKRKYPESKPYNANAALQKRSTELGLSDKENKQFSFTRLMRAMVSPSQKTRDEAGFEIEVCNAASQRSGYDTQGFLIPDDVIFKRALNTGSSGAGASGAFIGETLASSDLIPLLKNKAAILPFVTVLNGLVNNVSIPKRDNAPTGEWLGESGSLTATNLSNSNLKISPKKIGVLIEVTMNLISQSSIDVENMVVDDIITALALGTDQAILYGDGEDDNPIGIFNTSGLEIIDFANDVPTYQEVLAMKGAVKSANAKAGNFYSGSTMLSDLEGVVRFTNTGTPIYDSDTEKMAGRKAVESNQFLAGDILYGDASQIIMGRWGGIDLMVNPYNSRNSDKIEISAFDRVDIGVRQISAFAWGKKLP